MKIFRKIRETGQYKIWFAWHPVWCYENIKDDARLGLVWLETVARSRRSSEALVRYKYVLDFSEILMPTTKGDEKEKV